LPSAFVPHCPKNTRYYSTPAFLSDNKRIFIELFAFPEKNPLPLWRGVQKIPAHP